MHYKLWYTLQGLQREMVFRPETDDISKLMLFEQAMISIMMKTGQPTKYGVIVGKIKTYDFTTKEWEELSHLNAEFSIMETLSDIFGNCRTGSIYARKRVYKMGVIDLTPPTTIRDGFLWFNNKRIAKGGINYLGMLRNKFDRLYLQEKLKYYGVHCGTL